MRSTRAGRAIVHAAAALLLVVAVGCTHHSTQPTAARTGAPARSATSPPQLRSAAATSTAAAQSQLSCGNYIDTHAPTAPYQVVLGVVALPVSPAFPALGTARTGAAGGPTRLFAKTGLVIKAGTSFELVVPGAFSDRFRIGWGGAPSVPGHRVVVSHCANAGGAGWLAYPGGYWVDHPACVPLVVKAGSRQRQVHIGVGTACPGQRPPQGLSQS